MALSENIRKLREERHLTQRELADKMYVSRQTVSRWESGTRCPDLVMAKRLAGVLETSLDELLTDEDTANTFRSDLPFHSAKLKKRGELEIRQKRIMEFIEIAGAIFMAVSIFCKVQLEMQVPVWCLILGVCVVGTAFVIRYRISKKLDRLYRTEP